MLNSRQQQIQQLLIQLGRCQVEDLACRFQVTTMTIRRDLAAMEKQGILTRTHGGCVLQPAAAELPFREKAQQQRGEKLAIARQAVTRLRPGMAVYLDTGTTAANVARILPDQLRLRVFTPSLHVALELFDRAQTEVVVYGGALGRNSLDLTGEMALAAIRNFRLDLALVGADGLDPVKGEFFAADLPTAMLSRAAQEQADAVLACIDSSKFSRRGVAIAGRLDERTTLVTDNGVSRADRASLQKLNAAVVFGEIT